MYWPSKQYLSEDAELLFRYLWQQSTDILAHSSEKRWYGNKKTTPLVKLNSSEPHIPTIIILAFCLCYSKCIKYSCWYLFFKCKMELG